MKQLKLRDQNQVEIARLNKEIRRLTDQNLHLSRKLTESWEANTKLRVLLTQGTVNLPKASYPQNALLENSDSLNKKIG